MEIIILVPVLKIIRRPLGRRTCLVAKLSANIMTLYRQPCAIITDGLGCGLALGLGFVQQASGDNKIKHEDEKYDDTTNK